MYSMCYSAKNGFITIKPDEVRDITVPFLSEVCKDIKMEQSE